MLLYCQSPVRAANHRKRGSLPYAAPTILSVGGAAGVVDNGRPLPPSTWYCHSFAAPPRPPLRDAITYCPSGVHSGETYMLLLPFVSCVVSFLSRDMIHTFSPPERSLTNTIFLPSGE